MALLQTNEVKIGLKEDEHLEYKPFQRPADLTIAKKHGQARRVYLDKHHNGEKEEHEVCVCCGLPVEGELIPVTASLDKLYHLGAGYALYFKFIKYCIGILVLMLVVTGLFNLISNGASGDCEDDSDEIIYCHRGYIISYTIANKRMHDELLNAQLALNLVGVILVMIFFQYLRFQFRKTEIEAEDKVTSPADYTICIEGINPTATADEIIHWLEGFGTDEMQVKIIRVIKPFVITDYVELKNKIDEIKQQMDDIKNSGETPTKSDESRYKKFEVNLRNTEKRLATVKNQKLQHSSVAYVTFEKATHCDYIQSRFKRSILGYILGFFMSAVVSTKYHFQGKRVAVKRAPEPTDIMWENLTSGKTMKDLNRAITNFVTLLVVAMCFGVIYLVNWGQEKMGVKYGDDSFGVQAFSVIGSVVIVISNTVLSLTIHYLTGFEKHSTHTHFLNGVATKLVVAQFVNSALSTLFVELLLSDSKVAESENRLQAINFYGKGGLLESIYWVFISNSLLTPILTIFDFSYIFKLFNRHLFEKAEKANITQKQAHMLYEGSMMALPAKYATTLKIMLMTGFYAPAMPFALVYSTIGLILCYWADKYTLLRRHALPKSVDDSLTDSMVEKLEWTSVTYAVGNIVYVFTLQVWDNEEQAFPKEVSIPLIWVTFAVSLFHVFFPMELLNKKLFSINDEVTEQRTYDEVRLGFTTDYDLQNPSTKTTALREHLKRLKQSKGGAFLKNLRNAMVQKPLGDVHDIEDMFCGKEEEEVSEEQEFDFRNLDNYAEQVRHNKGTNNQAELDAYGDFFGNLGGGTSKAGKVLLSQFAPGFDTEKAESPTMLQPNQENATSPQEVKEKSKEEKGGIFGWLQPSPSKRGSKVGGVEGEKKATEEAVTPAEKEEKDGISGWLRQIPSKRGSKFGGGEEDKKIIDLTALNFIAPHFKDQDGDKTSKQGDSSGNIDPDDCVEESEPTAREFVVGRTVFGNNPQ